MDRCQVPRCRAEADITYLGHGVCERHWIKYTADDASPDALRMALGLEAAPVAAMEEAMEPTSTSKTTTEEPAAATSKPAKVKAVKKVKPAKQAKPKREPRSREAFDGEVVVFAFRLGSKDRDRIHDAAGPAKATKFVRSAAMAAATGDTKAFEALVAQAKANTK